MRWFILWLSFVISVALAFGLVRGVLALGMKDDLNLMLPLLPLFNAVIFPFLERLFPSAELRMSQKLEGRSPRGWTGALDPILLGFIAGMFAIMFLDFGVKNVYEHFSSGRGWFDIRLGSFANFKELLLGGFDPFAGRWRLVYLMGELVVISALAGLCVGLTSNGQAILNGLITGALLSLWMGANQFLSVYETISNLSWWIVGRFLGDGWEWNYGLLSVLFFQVFLCALFSGWGFRLKARTS